jgi:hypothetical protein
MGLVEVEVKLGKLGRLIRGAQSERPGEKRQSGVVDIDSGLRQGVLATLVRTWDEYII